VGRGAAKPSPDQDKENGVADHSEPELIPEQNQNAETLIVGVRFQSGGKVYTFTAGDCGDLTPGDFVIVDTAWGRQIGQVVYLHALSPEEQRPDLKPIISRASGADLALRQQLEEKAKKALEQARELAAKKSIPIKFVTAEYTLDGKRLTILYESEAKKGLQDLQQELGRRLRARVELRQIGPRDRAKLLGGYGACGEPRCCSCFLSEFSPISIRMAKTQGVSLTPSEITGMCGRLRCCLAYEHQMYAEASQSLPKRKANVSTPHGVGRVIDLLPLKGTIIVQIEDRRIEVPADEVKVVPKAPLAKGEESA